MGITLPTGLVCSRPAPPTFPQSLSSVHRPPSTLTSFPFFRLVKLFAVWGSSELAPSHRPGLSSNDTSSQKLSLFRLFSMRSSCGCPLLPLAPSVFMTVLFSSLPPHQIVKSKKLVCSLRYPSGWHM